MMPKFHLAPVLEALRFHNARPESLAAIPERHWPALLAHTDRARLTLALGVRCSKWLPASVRERIACDLTRNAERHRRLWSEYDRIAAQFQARGIEFVVLKGATHWPHFCDDPNHRPQYDFDLWCAPQDLESARAAAAECGFEAVAGRSDGPTDHLPTMIRRTGWQWRGDYYDPEMPPSIEIHFQLWNPAAEGIAVGDLDSFWKRRTTRRVPALSLPDTVSYAALHSVRHLLRGDLCPYHIYELAHFLERTCEDGEFWKNWKEITPEPLEAVTAIAFRLAREWFHCHMHPAIGQAADGAIGRWFQRYAFSPLSDSPNKDELWLHFALVKDRRMRHRILSRRVLPRPARATLAPHVRSESLAWKLRRQLYQTRFLCARAAHHLQALFTSAWHAARSSASQISD